MTEQELMEKMAENERELGIQMGADEPVALQMDVIVVNLVREGINKHRARELAEHFIKHTRPQEREPLTDEEIKELYGDDDNFRMVKKYVVAFARTIEAAHGITGKKK